MEKFTSKSVSETLDNLGTQREGLSEQEASLRQEKYGKNVLAEGKKKKIWQVFLEQFKDLLVVILMIAAIISGITGEWAGMSVILIVIILNAVLGTVQFVKAEKSLTALKALSSPTCKVVRNGVTLLLPSEEVVVGDIILLEAGDLVVADGRIIENFSLQINESSLTGESTAVDKTADVLPDEDIALGDRINMVFSGSLVTYGRAVMAVTATGMDTELGKIAALMNKTQEKKTPLQKSLDKFSKSLAMVIMLICVVVFGLTLWREFPLGENSVFNAILNSFTFAVALAVAAIPEALASIVTIVQAIGTQRMAKQNAVIKDLSAVETLGCVSVICSDKTGTLTQNKMTTQQVYVEDSLIYGEDLKANIKAHKKLIDCFTLVNDSTCQNGKEVGDPTEVALTTLAQRLGYNEIVYRNKYPRLNEIAFDSDRKLMSIATNIDGENVMLTKGALDVLLTRTTHIFEGDVARRITPQDIEKIEQANVKLSEHGLRVLAFAMKNVESTDINYDSEKDFTFIGLVSMIDPPREESIQAIADAKKAGIKTIMITGDHKITAQAIAKSIGIMEEGDIALEGVELEKMNDDELMQVLEKVTVYARVSPEHKIRIVNCWQNKGKIVSMTGDGVNDAPALKSADIGVAMGITGTEVSKDASSMILTDDNFATIVKSVSNGRNVYANIRNAVIFLLSGNIAGIFCILMASIAGWDVPFSTIHLLFINLLTDSLPAIAIGMEPSNPSLLYEKPRDPKVSILSKMVITRILGNGLIIFGATMASYSYGYFLTTNQDAMLGATMAFMTITLARLFHGFNCRGKESIFKLGVHTNLYVLGALFVGIAMLAGVSFIPGVNTLFKISPMIIASPYLLGYIVLFALIPTIVIQIVRCAIELINKIFKKNYESII